MRLVSFGILCLGVLVILENGGAVNCSGPSSVCRTLQCKLESFDFNHLVGSIDEAAQEVADMPASSGLLIELQPGRAAKR